MWEYSHEGKQLENKWVFRRLQKTGKVCADVMSGGRLFHGDLQHYSVHVYNIGHQYKQLKNLREHPKTNECVVLIDFSENYATKYET